MHIVPRRLHSEIGLARLGGTTSSKLWQSVDPAGLLGIPICRVYVQGLVNCNIKNTVILVRYYPWQLCLARACSSPRATACLARATTIGRTLVATSLPRRTAVGCRSSGHSGRRPSLTSWQPVHIHLVTVAEGARPASQLPVVAFGDDEFNSGPQVCTGRRAAGRWSDYDLTRPGLLVLFCGSHTDPTMDGVEHVNAVGGVWLLVIWSVVALKVPTYMCVRQVQGGTALAGDNGER